MRLARRRASSPAVTRIVDDGQKIWESQAANLLLKCFRDLWRPGSDTRIPALARPTVSGPNQIYPHFRMQ